MSGSSQDWTASDLRKALINRASQKAGVGAPPESLSAPTREMAIALSDYIYYYDGSDEDLPEEVEESEMYQIMMSRLETLTAFDAVRSGDISSMRGIAGSQYEETSVNLQDWKQYEVLKDLFRQEPQYDKDFTNSIFQTIVFSNNIPPTGRGKSDWMYSLIQFGQLVYPDARVLTNNTSDPYETTPEQWDELEEIIKEDSSEWKILGIDEAAQFLQYADQSGGKTISQRLKLLRHNRCHIILISHTGMDIPADIRRQVFVINKLNKETAQLGHGITPKSGDDRMEVAHELYRINNIPATDTEYDDIDDEGIEIKFGGESSDGEEVDTDIPEVDTQKAVAVAEYLSSDDGLRDVAERHDTTHETLRNWVEEFSDEIE